jgi:hypothetical protein
VALQGTIDSFALADVMRLLGSSSKTGRLIVNGDRGAADLWFESGALVGGGSSSQPDGADVADVVFDILRYQSGSFVFEADATSTELASAPREAAAVDAVIGQAEQALVEWSEIVSVVPSLDSWLTLAPELIHPEVVVDQACWTAIVTVAGGTTVREMGTHLGLGELPSSRLVRALVQAGFVEVGPPRTFPADGAGVSAGAPVADAPATLDLPMRHPHQVAEPVSFGAADEAQVAPSFDLVDSASGTSFDLVDSASGTSFDLVDASPGASFDHPEVAEDHGPDSAPVAAPDPFGSPEDGVALPSLTISGLTDDPFADGSFGDDAAGRPAASGWGGVLVEPEVPTDPPDVARSMSMLSDRAAQALATVVAKGVGPTVVADEVADGTDLDDERARMLRFLGSV